MNKLRRPIDVDHDADVECKRTPNRRERIYQWNCSAFRNMLS